jgi:hypothetical protein
MTDYFDRLELELRAATLRGTPRRIRPWPGLGAVATALGVAAAAAVAVVAIVALGRSQTPATPAATAASPYYKVCLPVKRVACLIDDFGVLRRPSDGARPTVPRRVVASMWFGGEAVHQTHVRLLPQFNRAVRIGATETILFVAHSSLGPPDFYPGAFFITGGRATFIQLSWPFFPAEVTLTPHRVTGWALAPSPGRWINGYLVTVVPDPVVRVRWAIPAQSGAPAYTVHANVHDNVAVASVPQRADSAVMTEYGRGGRVLAIQGHLPFGVHAVKPSAFILRSLPRPRVKRGRGPHG